MPDEERSEIEFNDRRFDLRYSEGLEDELARLASESHTSRAEVVRRWLRASRAERRRKEQSGRVHQDDQR